MASIVGVDAGIYIDGYSELYKNGYNELYSREGNLIFLISCEVKYYCKTSCPLTLL